MSLLPVGGPDARYFDTRSFSIDTNTVETLCAKFQIHRPCRWIIEKDQHLSHSNFLVYIKTTHHPYIFKFHPQTVHSRLFLEKNATTESLINRHLIKQKIATPTMLICADQTPFVHFKDYLVTAYTYLSGAPAYQRKISSPCISRIVDALTRFNTALRSTTELAPLLRTETLPQKIQHLLRAPKTEPLIRQHIAACHHHMIKYPHLPLKPVHANLSLGNIFFHKKQAYILDLGHIRNDHPLADLAALISSCFFLKTPLSIIKRITHTYCSQQNLDKETIKTLNTLVTIELVKDYIKNDSRRSNLELSPELMPFEKEYLNRIKERLKRICLFLQNRSCAKYLIIK